jgi:hypothetical protein
MRFELKTHIAIGATIIMRLGMSSALVASTALTLVAAGVAEPWSVRYAWQDNPQASVFNSAGLPAAPFRRDRPPRGPGLPSRDPHLDVMPGFQNPPRLSLGIVPVEEDGSVYFLAPPNKELIFQLLDEDFRAVHSMRSVAFVHKGEHLSCAGCHENPYSPPKIQKRSPVAFAREPSMLQAEPMGREPINFARHIKPILERVDLPCLGSPKKVAYNDLKNVAFYFAGGFRGHLYDAVHGGSRTIPGCYGTRVSILGNEAHAAWKAGKMAEKDYRTLTLWLDCHSLRLGAYHGEKAQLAGELVWPREDVVPEDPLGLEGQAGENTVERIFSNAMRMHPSDPNATKSWRCVNPAGEDVTSEGRAPVRLLVSDHSPNRIVIVNTANGALEWEYPCKHPQDLHWLKDGTILAAVGDEAQIIKPDLAGKKGGEVLWRVRPGGEVPVAQPLPDGGIMVACSSAGSKGLIIEYGSDRKETKRLEVSTRVTGHSQFRFCRKTPEGTYLVPAIGDGVLYELDPGGAEMRLQLPSALTERCCGG